LSGIDRQRLLEIVAEEVMKALGGAPASTPEPSTDSSKPPRPAPSGLLLLFTGSVQPTKAVWDAAVKVAQGASNVGAFLSRSFREHTSEEEILRLLPGTRISKIDLSARQLLKVADSYATVAIPMLSPNTAAKVASGIHDSGPSILLRHAIQLGKSILAARESLEPATEFCPLGISKDAPTEIAQLAHSHRLALERMGVRFVPLAELSPCSVEAITPKPQPAPPQRRFITEIDVKDLMLEGRKSLEVGAATVVTAAAYDYARSAGFEFIGLAD
jgi:hypothetical protein